MRVFISYIIAAFTIKLIAGIRGIRGIRGIQPRSL
jgi:hypothetical protein